MQSTIFDESMRYAILVDVIHIREILDFVSS